MLNLSRFLLLFAVVLVAARPVMACCLSGHAEPVIAPESQIAESACHEHPATSHLELSGVGQEPASPMNCAGCLDCDTVILKVPSVDDGALLSQGPSEVPLVAVAARFAGFEYRSPIFHTGPPGDPPTLTKTPLKLKQRLLI